MLFSRKKEFGGTYSYLIVGLGNPGSKYEMTRHNAGFLAVDLLALQEHVDIKKLKFHALVGDVRLGGERCLLMKPQTMMNLSGDAVAEAANFYKIPPERVLVLFDDISLDVGRTRVRRKGSAGGHNGIKSIIARLGSQDFPRVKIGVGAKPNPDHDLADWVLGSFSALDEKAMAVSLENAGQAALAIIDKGVPEAANRFNGSHP